MSPTATETVLVTRVELLELQQAEEDYKKAQAEATAAENKLKPLRLKLAEKVLGVKTAEDFRELSPEEIDALMTKRRGKFWETVRGCPQFSFVETKHGRYPAWKEEFIRAQGVSASEQVIADTPMFHSYRVAVGG